MKKRSRRNHFNLQWLEHKHWNAQPQHNKSHVCSRKKAQSLNHKILLDPVGAGASTLRTKTALALISKIKFDVIRGNISEIKTLATGSGKTKGVDANIEDAVSESNLESAVAFAKNFAEKQNCVVAITGAIDLVSDGKNALSSETANRRWDA